MIAHHYKKIQAGMRCHCFVEDPEDIDICRTCYNVGIRGGYEYATLPRINPYQLREVDHNLVQFGASFAHFVVPGDVIVLQKEGVGVPYYVAQVSGSAFANPAPIGGPVVPKLHLQGPTVGWEVVARQVEKTDPVYVFCLDWA
jgi:hypothetical protein